MVAVSLLMVVFVLRAATLFVGVQDQQPNMKARPIFVGFQHLALTLMILSGLVLLVMNNFAVQAWFYAKIILFLVLWSSLIKTYKKDTQILLAQRRAGLVIGAIAFIGILVLVISKPVFA